jgi:hypothetical protein
MRFFATLLRLGLAASAVLGAGAPLLAQASAEPEPEFSVDEPVDAVLDAEEAHLDSVSRVATWVNATGDNEGLPFVVVDKAGGAVYAFGPAGDPLGDAPALLGSAIGDDSAPGIGEQDMAAIPPDQRTTPAGRFVATYGFANGNKRVLWVDFSTALSLHPVVPGTRREKRLERISSPTPEDNRITYGCINVPSDFYSEVIEPLFADSRGVVYIIPETRALDEVFLSFRDID